MSGFRPLPGNEFLLSGKWHRVETYERADGYIIAVDQTGTLSHFTLEALVHHPELTVPGQKAAVIDMSGQVTEHDRRLAMLRVAEVQEVLTGYRSGTADEALVHEPRPQYDPLNTFKKGRYIDKETELNTPANRELGLYMSISTMRRIEDAIKKGDSVAHSLGKHKPRRSNGRRTMTGAFEKATREVIESRKRSSTVVYRTLWIETQGRLIQENGKTWFDEADKPSFSTWRRWVGDHYTRSEIKGRASTRASSTTAPKGGFNRANLTRPGEFILMDTNSLDTLLKGTKLEGAVRGSLVAALDGYSASCVALRVAEQAETAVDVAMTFLDIGRPKQMDPQWGSEYRWPFVGMPEHVLGTIGGCREVAGIPVVNTEALSIDHGGPYKSRKVRDLAKRYQFDILPARVRTGADKALVERFFGAVRTMLLEKLAGYRGSHPGERGENVDGEVQWTAQALEDLLTEWVILVWQTHILEGHKPPWCPEGDWSPNDLYQHGILTSGFMPNIMTSEDYYAAVRTKAVKIHSRGLKINGLFYDSGLLDPWRNKPAPTGSKLWTVQSDDRDLRYVWWIDAEGQRHRIRWTGLTDEFPAFSRRHVNALRKRVGTLDRHDPNELAVILLTQVLPLPDDTGNWSADNRKANAAASAHQRDLELLAADQAKAGIPPYEPNNETVSHESTPGAAQAPQPEDHRAKHDRSIAAARKAQRVKATASGDIEAAPQLGTRRASLLGGYHSIETDGAA
jgi:transposase InsO family protein